MNADAMREILAHFQLDVDQMDGEGDTLLHKAARAGNTSMVAALLDAGSVDQPHPDLYGNYALHRAALHGHVEVARLLIDADGDPNVRNILNCTPLHNAAETGHVEVARFLIAAGAYINCVDNCVETPLHKAASCGNLGLDVARLLLEAGCMTDTKNVHMGEPLHAAARFGADETIKCLLAFGANVNSGSGTSNTPLLAALDMCRRRTLAMLLEAGATIDMGQLKRLPRYNKNSTQVVENAHRRAVLLAREPAMRYLDKVVAAGGYEHLVRTYRRVLTAPRGCLTRYLRRRFGRDAPHDVAARVLEYWKPPGGP